MDVISINTQLQLLTPDDLHLDASSEYLSSDEKAVLNGEKQAYAIKVALYINNKKMPLDTLLAELVQEFYTQGAMYFSTVSKAYRNNTRTSAFYPFNCSCGAPGCARLHEGVHSHHKKWTVHWTIPKNKGYEAYIKPQTFVFKKEQYLQELKQALSVLTIAKEKQALIQDGDRPWLCSIDEYLERYYLQDYTKILDM